MSSKTKASSMRLDKLLTQILPDMTRSYAAAYIKEGHVTVNDLLVRSSAQKVKADDKVALDGEEVSLQPAFYYRVFMLNKPMDMVSADHDAEHPAVGSIFADEPRAEELHCIGRLDLDATGLLIVTDDGELNHQVTSPKKAIIKRYYAVTDRDIPASAVEVFKSGVRYPGEKKSYAPAVLHILDARCAEVEVTEGRFHEVKRLFETVGCTVIELTRLQIGSLKLDPELAEGEYRSLSNEEISLLLQNPDQD